MSAAIRILALFGARVVFGQERANIEALAVLKDQGCEVLCVIRDETWPELLDLRRRLDARGLAWETAPYVDYPTRGWILHGLLRNPRAWIAGNLRLLQLARRFRPTHIHAFNPLYVASGILALSILGLPMIYRAGDAPTTHNVFYRAVWRYVSKTASAFVADSEYIKRLLVEHGAPTDRIEVLYAPPPQRPQAARFDPPPLDARAVKFAFVGQLIPEKGLQCAIAATRDLAQRGANIALLVAGRISDWSGDDWARNLREACRQDPELADRVHFLGMVEDINGLLRACDVLVAPSLKEEPYGLVVVEAKNAGICSIVFESGGMPELVAHQVDGMVVQDRTSRGLSEAMQSYIDDPGRIRAQGDAALRSLERFRYQDFQLRWLDIYRGAQSEEPECTHRER